MIYEDFSTWPKREESTRDTTTTTTARPDPVRTTTAEKWQELTETYSAADAGSLGVSPTTINTHAPPSEPEPKPTIAELNSEVRDSVGPGNFSDGRNSSAVGRQQAAIAEHVGTENPGLYQPDVVAFAERNGFSYNEAVGVLNQRNAELPSHIRGLSPPTEPLRPVAELAADYAPDRAVEGSRGDLDVTHGSVYDRTAAVIPDTTASDEASVDNRLAEIAVEMQNLEDSISGLGSTGGRVGDAMQAQLDELRAEATLLLPVEDVGFGNLDEPPAAVTAIHYFDASVHERGGDDPLYQAALHQRNEAVLRFAGGDAERANDIIINLNNGMGVAEALTLSSFETSVADLSASEGISPEVAERLVAMEYHNAGAALPGVVEAFDPQAVFEGERNADFDTAKQLMAGETDAEADDFTSEDDFDAVIANPDRYHPDVVAAAMVYKEVLDNPEILGEENHAEFQEQFSRKSLREQIMDSAWLDPNTDSWVVNLARMGGGLPPSPAFMARVIEEGPGTIEDLDNSISQFRPENQVMTLVTDPNQALENYRSFGAGIYDWGVEGVKLGVGVYALNDPVFHQYLESEHDINVRAETANMLLSSGQQLINDPDAVGEAVIGWDQLVNDPWRWAGTIAPEIVIEIATMGGATPFTAGTKAATTTVRAVDGVTDAASVARRTVPDGLDAGTDIAAAAGRSPNAPSFGDPVFDVADAGGVFDPDDVLGNGTEIATAPGGRRPPDDPGVDATTAAAADSPDRRPPPGDDTDNATQAQDVDEMATTDDNTNRVEVPEQERVPVGVGAGDQQLEYAGTGARGADNADAPMASSDRTANGGAGDAPTTPEFKTEIDETSPETQRGGGADQPPPPDRDAPGGFADDELPDFESLTKKEQAGDSPGYLNGEVPELVRKEELGIVVETYVDGDDGYIHVVEKDTGERTILFEDPDGSVRVGPEVPEPEVDAPSNNPLTEGRPKTGLQPLDTGANYLFNKHQAYFEQHGKTIHDVKNAAHDAKHADTTDLGAADNFKVHIETGDVWPPIKADDGTPPGNIYQELKIPPPPED